ncbi:hypothetical protein AVEN_238069-1 [Araneus ventricosus]|uniref:Uncharacterized protein n=1 Tax=Araneus ventricosus TaxID=182803 RepID=A0A4Y2HZW4_ARAVE|nr:hypothetical protein AVEN_238069-1 [Araneus ventricosus]
MNFDARWHVQLGWAFTEAPLQATSTARCQNRSSMGKTLRIGVVRSEVWIFNQAGYPFVSHSKQKALHTKETLTPRTSSPSPLFKTMQVVLTPFS